MEHLTKDRPTASDFEHLALNTLLDLDSEANDSGHAVENNTAIFLMKKFREYNVQETCYQCNTFLEKKDNIQTTDCKKCLVPSEVVNTDMLSFIDPVFGLRIVKPLISSLLLTERMSSRKVVTFSELSKNLTSQDLPKEWVIAGVILSKEIRKSSKNDHFTIWKLSDLRGDLKTLSLLLFQNAHDELWKTSLGTCIAVLKPCFMEKKSSGDIASLSINSAKKVLLLGKSKDMGVCKAKKNNGERCKNFVNISECDFCSYHVQREYKKMTRPVTSRRFKYHDNLKTSLDSVSSLPSCHARILLQKDKLSKASNCEMEQNQRLKDMQRLKYLRSNLTSTTSSPTENCKKYFDLEVNISLKEKAINVIKNCPIEKIDPNSTRGSKEGKRSAIDKIKNNSPKRLKKEDYKSMEEILGKVSGHKDLIDVRQKEEEEKYFNKLEKKEAMEEKMLNIFQIPCKAVICKICKYAAFSAADRCKDEHHTIKIIDAVKRFFQCLSCGNRTSTLFKFPKLSCANCTSSRWQRCGMVRDRTNPKPVNELSIRGDEETFLGGAYKSNINLLAP
ncbi:protein MCM10 homolog isoform X2 [Eurosta solidaginis]|uniref:protein MCM10 homolog isoform X2 n=1 Tax=Eurosta solidaginis TaxID=178769 RepID=UPI0035306785